MKSTCLKISSCSDLAIVCAIYIETSQSTRSRTRTGQMICDTCDVTLLNQLLQLAISWRPNRYGRLRKNAKKLEQTKNDNIYSYLPSSLLFIQSVQFAKFSRWICFRVTLFTEISSTIL
jgi:hypothetical protein